MVEYSEYRHGRTLDEQLKFVQNLGTTSRLVQSDFETAVDETQSQLRSFHETVKIQDWTSGWWDTVEATALMYTAHAHQQRHGGQNYASHPLWVANTLTKELDPEDPTLTVAALLHDFNEKGAGAEQLDAAERADIVSQIDEQAEPLVNALTTTWWPPSATKALYEQVSARYQAMQSPSLGRLQGRRVRPSYRSKSVENDGLPEEGLMEVTKHFRYAANIRDELSDKPGALFVKAYDLSHNGFKEDVPDSPFISRVSNKYRTVVDWFEEQVKEAPLETEIYSISESGRDNLVSRIRDGREVLEEHASDWEHYRLQNKLWRDLEGK